MADTDHGPEFQKEFEQMLQKNNISHRIKGKGGINNLAVVDRKIQTLKQIIHDKKIKTQDKGRSGLWDKALAGIVASINHAPTEKLKGESPDDVAEDTQKK